MTYELWNVRARSLVGGFDTQAEALACVREALQRHGRSYIDALLLGSEDRHGRSKPIARGQALAKLALEDGAAPATRSIGVTGQWNQMVWRPVKTLIRTRSRQTAKRTALWRGRSLYQSSSANPDEGAVARVAVACASATWGCAGRLPPSATR